MHPPWWVATIAPTMVGPTMVGHHQQQAIIISTPRRSQEPISNPLSRTHAGREPHLTGMDIVCSGRSHSRLLKVYCWVLSCCVIFQELQTASLQQWLNLVCPLGTILKGFQYNVCSCKVRWAVRKPGLGRQRICEPLPCWPPSYIFVFSFCCWTFCIMSYLRGSCCVNHMGSFQGCVSYIVSAG